MASDDRQELLEALKSGDIISMQQFQAALLEWSLEIDERLADLDRAAFEERERAAEFRIRGW